jgi:hypothetical protein
VNILNKRNPDYIDTSEDLPTPPATPPSGGGGGYVGAGGKYVLSGPQVRKLISCRCEHPQ